MIKRSGVATFVKRAIFRLLGRAATSRNPHRSLTARGRSHCRNSATVGAFDGGHGRSLSTRAERGLKTYRVKSTAKKKPAKAKAASCERFVRHQDGPPVETGGYCNATVIMVGGEKIPGWCLVAAIE
jgi:hypothetical protein